VQPLNDEIANFHRNLRCWSRAAVRQSSFSLVAAGGGTCFFKPWPRSSRRAGRRSLRQLPSARRPTRCPAHDRPFPVLESRHVGELERRIAEQSEQGTVRQAVRPIRRSVAVHEHHDARQIKDIENDRRRQAWCRQNHVANIVREKPLSDDAEEKEIEWKQNDQRAQIDDSVSSNPPWRTTTTSPRCRSQRERRGLPDS